MIDIRKLKELVRLMVSNDLTELDLRDSEEQVTLRRASVHGPPHLLTNTHHAAGQAIGQAAGQAPPAAGAAHGQAPGQAAAASAPPAGQAAAGSAAPRGAPQGDGASAATAVAEEDGLVAIESPMVGTFYSAPNPDSPPFVDAGATVDAETVVCIIEAMKIFNEIKAECAGTVARVLVSNGEAVEFGQPLFMIRPE